MKEKRNNRGSATVWLIIILIIVIMALAVAITFYVISSKKEDKQPQNANNTNNQGEVATSGYYEPTEEETKRAEELADILKNDLPEMDGSTSTIPLEAGIIANLFNMSQEEAEAGITHSTTYGSYDNLLAGNCDIIFSTPLSEEQKEQAEEQNIELVLTPIVYEGFVFVVNADNPVDTLTQEQIKDIYSGEITNWKEVGGNDAEIVAYQRDETSGSQNYMKDFMKDSNLMEPTTSFIPGSMQSLMEAVAVYDNAENAIGYSVYAYAANMYGNGEKVKFIKVDGVEPTKETMASQEYPLLNYNYAIYDKSKEEATTVDELVEWILTYNGQVAMVNAGYVPVKNVKVEEQEITPYTKLGTGEERTSNELAKRYYYAYGYINENNEIYGLKNEELQNKINQFISESTTELNKINNEYLQYVQILNNKEHKGEYEEEIKYNADGITVMSDCMNGYLSIKVSLTYSIENHANSYTYYYAGYSKIYDLYTGNELELSDLYYKDVDFIAEINKSIAKGGEPYTYEDLRTNRWSATSRSKKSICRST